MDDDFFASCGEAAANAGHAVADAWAEASHDLKNDTVLGLVGRAVAAGPEAAARPVLRLETAAARRKAPTAQTQTAAASELAEFLVDAGARQPQDLGGARRQEWVSFLKVLAAKKVAAAKTQRSNGRTLRELSQYQVVRGGSGGLSDVDAIDLFSFLREKAPRCHPEL